MIRDRAEIVATAIFRVVADALRNRIDDNDPAILVDARAAIAAYLRGEFADIDPRGLRANPPPRMTLNRRDHANCRNY